MEVLAWKKVPHISKMVFRKWLNLPHISEMELGWDEMGGLNVPFCQGIRRISAI